MTPTRSGLTGISSTEKGRTGSATGRERRVECRGGRLDLGEPSYEGKRVGSAHGTVHARVLPLDGYGPAIADAVQHPEHRLPRDVAVTGGDEVPPAAGVSPGQVGGQPAVATVEPHLRLLAVDVVDPLAEVPQEVDRVEVLPDEVTRV